MRVSVSKIFKLVSSITGKIGISHKCRVLQPDKQGHFYKSVFLNHFLLFVVMKIKPQPHAESSFYHGEHSLAEDCIFHLAPDENKVPNWRRFLSFIYLAFKLGPISFHCVGFLSLCFVLALLSLWLLIYIWL